MMRTGIVIPYFNHAGAIALTLAALRKYRLPCWIVNDGSRDAESVVLQELVAQYPDLHVIAHESNCGKGVAVATGMRAARAAGCTHAIQIDADNQHDADDVATMLALAQAQPTALISGTAVYDETVPRARRYGRYVTHFWVWLHTLSFTVRDSMCGLRLYPIEAMLRVWDRERVGRRMDFDTDILVRMYWDGTPLVQVPTRVRYPSDGVSHFDMWRDNLRISWMHTRLFFGMLHRLPKLLAQRRRMQASAIRT
jgi:glycosyltransferase involved in cell wall biosynthesis